jgi:hypothetical protein
MTREEDRPAPQRCYFWGMNDGMRIETEVIIEDLPGGFDVLRAGGFHQIDRLRTDWDAGTIRFDRDGEALLAVRVNGTLAGIGGVTVDPVVPSALRMRRFSVGGTAPIATGPESENPVSDIKWPQHPPGQVGSARRAGSRRQCA